MYPIFATYKAFERYQTSAAAASAGTVNVAGIQVPIVSILKRAGSVAEGGNTSLPSEESLQVYLITTQKWLVFWIVFAAYTAVESILPLKFAIPFYSLWKTILFAWMISPMVMMTNSSATAADVGSDWLAFSSSGCGLCYYHYLRPWLEGEVNFLYKFEIPSSWRMGAFTALSSITLFPMGYFGTQRGSSTTTATTTTDTEAAYPFKLANMGATYINQYLSRRVPEYDMSANAAKPMEKIELEEEFDFVDRPAQLPEPVVRRNLSIEAKRGWW